MMLGACKTYIEIDLVEPVVCLENNIHIIEACDLGILRRVYGDLPTVYVRSCVLGNGEAA